MGALLSKFNIDLSWKLRQRVVGEGRQTIIIVHGPSFARLRHNYSPTYQGRGKHKQDGEAMGALAVCSVCVSTVGA